MLVRGSSIHVLWLFVIAGSLSAENQAIPHAQDKPPNEPRDPQTAAGMMTVPEGFVVEVVAAEPDIVNPVAMTFDEQGRVWITESLEYPRKEPGPGKDRVKILEDTDGDGVMDRFSIFLDGLNIPSGVAVGHGGVWVANSPDILFVPDKNRDGKPDGEPQVVVTGFGRTDTHELPNSLTWGPDGWLYGLNGVFNHSHVKYPASNPNFQADHPGWKITCAMFRIHPRTREFQVFAEGTSNPWGIAFNDEGDAFVSACVIDHLWHIVETGYYHRQGGPYPPHTWKIESIVEHKHQKAAYCGITWFDSDAYPEKYRRKLYMGNIHGGCINVDRIERNGSTYKGFGEPDFLAANDAWFMPVVQKTGPDGCLWILDWYDRYHCYQDANRDPAGIDRLKGRLYRVRYDHENRDVSSRNSAATRDGSLDLAAETDDQLIEKLGHSNVWMRETAQRLLQERNTEEIKQRLISLLLADNGRNPDQTKHLVYALAGCDYRGHNYDVPEKFFKNADPFRRAWAVRWFASEWMNSPEYGQSEESPEARLLLPALRDADPRVRLQATIAIGKYTPRALNQVDYGQHLAQSLLQSPEDLHAAKLAWIASRSLMELDSRHARSFFQESALLNAAIGGELAERMILLLISRDKVDWKELEELFADIFAAQEIGLRRRVLTELTRLTQTGELGSEKLGGLRAALSPVIQPLLQDDSNLALRFDASLLALGWKDQSAVGAARKLALNPKENADRRVAALNALIAAKDDGVIDIVASVLSSEFEITNLKSQILQSTGRLDHPRVAEVVLAEYTNFPVDLQPRAIELLTQRAGWAKSLLAAIGAKTLKADAININQARRLRELKDEELTKMLQEHWGELRDGRNPDRERIVAEMKAYIRDHRGDEANGEKVFKKVCGQCHKLYGEGAEVGPDITRNGRNDYQQLLSNVFDPSLVIGVGYRSYTVVTYGGRVVNGLLVEESPQRVVLKVQGGKQEIIPRDDIDEFHVSELSLMPEQLEKQITLPEIADLFAYLTLDKPPADADAKRLAGVYEIVSRETENPAEYASVFQEVAPGFTSAVSGERGIGLLETHRGRKGVVRTHPVSKDQAAIMKGRFAIPKDQKTTLIIDVSHDERGDWRLLAGGRGERLLDEMISAETCPDGWATFRVDLSKFAGQEIEVQVWNQANNWSWEFGYWGSVRILSE